MKNILIKTFSILTILVICFVCIFIPQKVINCTKIFTSYNYKEYPLTRNNIKLHLDRTEQIGKHPKKNILLVHGVTYSSHEFDINYKDYSLVRALAREGYAVWSLDIAGYGRSEAVKDGFLPDSDYAAKDIKTAVEKIIQISGQDKIDLLGWSWGTITTSLFAAKHPEHLNKLVLYSPILSGIGQCEISEPFHHNTWEHATEDFQLNKNGKFDYTIIDPTIIELWASNCWHYDKETSPNGGRRDICIDNSEKLIDLSKLKTPTLIVYGDKDPYMNYEMLDNIQTQLPEGSETEVIKGGSHVVFIEKPYYKNFQKILVEFLNK